METIKRFIVVLFALLVGDSLSAQRSETLLTSWKFHLGDEPAAASPDYDDSGWARVLIPHDWAITGPFDMRHDLQNVAVIQNGETDATLKTGRTGGLPYIGCGWYRTSFETLADSRMELVFDGAMSEPKVYVNGHEVCFWPYGYNSFHCDVSPFINPAGERNIVSVRLENLPFSSRWYPGAGLYRNVHLVSTSQVVYVPVWGTYVTTPEVSRSAATVHIETSVVASEGKMIECRTALKNLDGEVVAFSAVEDVFAGKPFVQELTVEEPALWSPETPHCYTAVTSLYVDGRCEDTYETLFGIRSIEFKAYEGFFLNGERRQFKGVCNHHDLGPLGAAVHVDALRHQLALLKDMGCDAIRTSHNMPAPELVRLCDEMGFMMMIEPFDEWNDAKCPNGYHRWFDEWAEKDMVNMLHQYRNDPCVILWSIGNEVPSQRKDDGWKTAAFLQDICHREDPTRPVTCGMDQVDAVLANGFAKVLDIPGINYRTYKYLEAYETLSRGFILGSETASTVSSRGIYHFPVVKGFSIRHEDNQSSGYDLEACKWSNIPDVDFALADDYKWDLGQFVWTGFDYLGEPSPYDTDAWPSHSSVFGIIDLASIPKDRYYLYRSVWNTDSPTLHIVPHWTWPSREGLVTPVFVYTSYPEAELFVNGISQGRRTKNAMAGYPARGLQDEDVESRYRLMWDNVVYQRGKVEVVAYDKDGRRVASEVVRTAGQPHRLKLEQASPADGRLVYYTVSVVDRQGIEVPDATDEIFVSVKGSGRFKAMANGDPTCLELFQEPHMHLFAGKLTVIVERDSSAPVELTVTAKGLRKAQARIY